MTKPNSALQAGGDETPVAQVLSWTNGSYSRNYQLRWLRDVPEGTQLFTRPTPAAAEEVPIELKPAHGMPGYTDIGGGVVVENFIVERITRAVLSAGAPAVPLKDEQDSDSSHLAADGSSRALRAASRGEAVGDGDSAPTQQEAL